MRRFLLCSDVTGITLPRMDLKDFAGMKAIEFQTDALDVLRGPGVYMYCERDRALYIGASRKIVGRIFARNHHIRKGLRAATSLLIFPCESWEKAQTLESDLTATLKPRLNMRNFAVSPGKRLAELLGNTTQATVHMYLRKPTA